MDENSLLRTDKMIEIDNAERIGFINSPVLNRFPSCFLLKNGLNQLFRKYKSLMFSSLTCMVGIDGS
jgi:hypothetical protein